MNNLLAKVFQRRNITPQSWTEMNDPSWGELAGIDQACEALHAIHEANEKIVVLPDFDMDGIMSGTVGIAALCSFGFDAELFIPHPEDGYGFKARQVERLIAEHPGVSHIITCDTGIGCLEGVRSAVEKGISVIVTDHHKEKESDSPRELADAVVDPCAIGESYPHPGICGAFVMWQVMNRYAETYGTPDDLRRMDYLRVFAGIGTVSDMMPLLYENRELVRDAMRICHECWKCSAEFLSVINSADERYKSAFRGLYAAMNMFSGAGKLPDPAALNEEFFGFYMAPAFNSVKRLDGEMSRAFDVFTGTTPSDNVSYLIGLNEQRKQETEKSLASLLAQDNPYAPYCFITDAKAGIRGLLATKLLQKTGYPCVVVGKSEKGNYSGSGRCPGWYPFFAAQDEVDGICMSGHDGAFGFSAVDGKALGALFAFLDEDVPKVYDEIPEEQKVASYDITISETDKNADTGIDEECFIEFVEELESYRPFGKGFEMPSFKLGFSADDAEFKLIGAKKNHLKIQLTYGFNEKFDILCWNQGSAIDGNVPEGELSVIGKLEINEFGGRRKPQMVGELVI